MQPTTTEIYKESDAKKKKNEAKRIMKERLGFDVGGDGGGERMVENVFGTIR